MEFLKAHWRPITFAAVCLAAAGIGAWGYMGGAEIEEKLQAIDRLRSAVEQQGRNAANARVIEAKEKEVAKANEDFAQAEQAALALQQYNAFESHKNGAGKGVLIERKPLIPDALPKPASASVAIEFRRAYEKAFDELSQRLNGRPKPTSEEINDNRERLAQLRSSGEEHGPWGPGAMSGRDDGATARERPLVEILRDYPRARVSEEIAKRIWMYVDEYAFGKHDITRSADAPSDVAIWQAQMSLWIQQDIAEALARCNEARAAELRKAKREDDLWVAHMPVKRLAKVSIDNRLGKGGGSNAPRSGFIISFTGQDNNNNMFVVPIAVEVVVEEASMMKLIDELCRVGFYTPTGVSYELVPPNPLQEDYLYGPDPVVEMTLHLEGYYFRKVFDQWIPKSLDAILKRPGAKEDTMGRG